jgi:hydrogenase 3 maturation protease
VQDLTSPLKQALEGAKIIAVLGVGSELRGDDWAGMAAALEIEKGVANLKGPELKVFFGETAPENLTGEIKKFNPTHLLILDCGDFGGAPGDIKLILPEQESFNAAFTTHKLPMKVLVDYLRRSIDLKALVVLIQPRTIEFGKPVSKEVQSAADRISKAFFDALKG